MRILVLGAQSDKDRQSEIAYYEQVAGFFHATAHGKAEVCYALLDDLRFRIKSAQTSVYDTRNDCNLETYDAVFMRGHFRKRLDIAHVVSDYMHTHGKHIVNDYSHARTSSKLSQAYLFADLGIPTPETICGSSQVLLDASQTLAMPFICKEVYGAHGDNNHFVTSQEQLHQVLAHADGLFVLQEYVPNEGDYRLLCVGDEHLIIWRSAAPGSHLNNTSQGGHAELLPDNALPDIVLEQARRCLKRLDMTIAGVDIIYDKAQDRYLFLEVNSQPQLVTGAFVDEKQRLLGVYLDTLSSKQR